MELLRMIALNITVGWLFRRELNSVIKTARANGWRVETHSKLFGTILLIRVTDEAGITTEIYTWLSDAACLLSNVVLFTDEQWQQVDKLQKQMRRSNVSA
jgi:hypothetical protein